MEKKYLAVMKYNMIGPDVHVISEEMLREWWTKPNAKFYEFGEDGPDKIASVFKEVELKIVPRSAGQEPEILQE